MPESIEFTRNYTDLSTDQGFQFEFFCDRCGNGFRTTFQPSATGRMNSVLDAAGSLIGGVFGSAADLGRRAQDATWQHAHDKALLNAANELRPHFSQCPHCQVWVCRKSCWNDKRGLCKECGPDMGVEMSAAQAARSREEVWAHAKMSAEDKKLSEGNWRQTIVAQCPNCQTSLEGNLKFCPECGTKLHSDQHCTECGEPLKGGAKFCGNCGKKVE